MRYVLVRSASTGQTATVTVKLSAAPAVGETVTVNVATVNGTAFAGTDYTALATTPLTFTAGQLTRTVTVPVLPAANGTPGRTFSLALSSPSTNAFVADSAAIVRLIGP